MIAAFPPYRVDSHVHILNIPLSPDEFSTGQRFGLSRSEMAIFTRVIKLAKTVDLPDPAEEVLGIVDDLLEALPWTSRRWQGVKQLLRLYVMPTRRAVRHLLNTLQANHVREACLLIPPGPGLKLRALQELAEELAGVHPGEPKIHLFVPRWAEHLMPPGSTAGVKVYPSMEPLDDDARGLEEPVRCGITHGSPGGIRALDVSALEAKRLNHISRWQLALSTTKTRLVYAHAGGVDQFMGWLLRGQHAPGENWALDNLLRDTCPGLAELPGRLWVDIAFHERMFEPAYARAIAALQPWWNVLPGTDYPLTEPFYPYARAIARVNELVPDGARQLHRFLTGED